MKYALIGVALVISCTFNHLCGQVATKKTDSIQLLIPKVVLVYQQDGTVFDRNCATLLNKPIQQEWIEETANRLNEFQSLWDKDGPEYLKTALQEVGGTFPFQEVQATLTVCPMASMSSPLIVSVKNFLSTAEKPRQPDTFAEDLFHELLHTYTRPVYDQSPLRSKYAAEAPVVLNHLHVMALEKFVLQKLGKTALLKWLDSFYRSGKSPGPYERAWDIVDKIEGHEAFINELKLVYKKNN